MQTIKINVYKAAGEWFGARWIGDEYDGCDPLGIDSEASDAEAIAFAALMPLSKADETPRTVQRVADVDSK